MIQLRPTEADLRRLKRPLGELLPGPPSKTIPRLQQLIQETQPSFMTSVGDIVSRETVAAGVLINLQIVDQRSMRESLAPHEYQARVTYQVRNPAGTISIESWDTIRTAMKQNQSVILVDGEEDLLALPCILESRENSLVLYGQPSEGMVVVRVSPGVRKEVDRILKRSQREEA